jgi:hypothetical protein
MNFFMFCVQQVPVSILSPDAYYPDRILWFPSVPPGFSGIVSKTGHGFLHPFQLKHSQAI